MVSSALQVGWVWLRQRRFETMHLVTLGLITVLGGATLLLQDEMFIKWKPTIVNWLFGAVLIGSHFIGEKPIIARMLGASITLPMTVWTRLSLAWSLFFIALGLINLYVVYNFDTDTWVNFKLFGMMGLTLIFVIAQSFYIARHMAPGDTAKEEQ